jgi:hypothetical protein
LNQEGGQFSKVERQAVIKDCNQLDDSSSNVKMPFYFHIIKPIAYDTLLYSSSSALNM